MGGENEKKVVDLERLSSVELLHELVERLCAYRKSKETLLEWEQRNDWNDEMEWRCSAESAPECDKRMFDFHEDLKMDNDEDYCRVREVVRFVKGDDHLWTD